MAQLKAQNDPWTPLPEETVGISQPPVDPRYQLIDSARYIDSLEKKLKHFKGKHKPEPSSREIINSLSGFRDDQMRRFLSNGCTATTPTTPIIAPDSAAPSGSTSYLQRRLRPERQALNMEELFELLKDDELARNRSEEEEGEEDTTHALRTEGGKREDACEKDERNVCCGDSSKEIELDLSKDKEKSSSLPKNGQGERGEDGINKEGEKGFSGQGENKPEKQDGECIDKNLTEEDLNREGEKDVIKQGKEDITQESEQEKEKNAENNI